METVRFLELDDQALLAQCVVDVYRASGPGGQKRNKIESAVRLRHQPTGLSAHGEESRSQHENRARALKRLRRTIALRLRSPVDVERYRPSELLAGCMTSGGKLHLGKRDARFNPVVQEILDVLFACGVQMSTAAKLIGVTTANLSGLLREQPFVWRRVNEMRTAAGLKGLK